MFAYCCCVKLFASVAKRLATITRHPIQIDFLIFGVYFITAIKAFFNGNNKWLNIKKKKIIKLVMKVKFVSFIIIIRTVFGIV
jgi:hypothetical protein